MLKYRYLTSSHKELLFFFKQNCSQYRDCDLFSPVCLESNKPIDSYNNHSSKLKIISIKALLLIISLLFTFNHAYGLIAMTTKVINGNKPYLLLPDGTTKLTNIDELLGFKMPKRDGSDGMEQIDLSMVNTALTIPAGMKYNDVLTIVTADGTIHSLEGMSVGDVDGDADIVANTNVKGEIKATWYNEGSAVPASDLSQTLSDCDSPHTLEISIPIDVIVNTKYGNPNTNFYGTHDQVTYTFMPTKPRICYIQPHSMYVADEKSDGFPFPIKFAAGYNPTVWKPAKTSTGFHKGFKVESGFPTTGFKGAQFSLIGSGIDQSNYRCKTSNGNGKISLSNDVPIDNQKAGYSAVGNNCTVTYNSETKAEFTAGGTPTITMEYNTGSSWIEIGSYQIPTPSKWAIGKGEGHYGWSGSLGGAVEFDALDTCRGNIEPMTTRKQATQVIPESMAYRQKYLYRRDEISNSPYANRGEYPENSAPSWVSSRSARDVDGTFTGEWGFISDYGNSGWSIKPVYWTSEIWKEDEYVFFVSSDGDIAYASPNADGVVIMCRGD